jgi:hypothetical protein
MRPVIAAAHGVCFGLAIDILCAADIRYAVCKSVEECVNSDFARQATSSQFSIKVDPHLCSPGVH